MFTYFLFPAFYQLENLTSHVSGKPQSGEPSQLKTKPRRNAVQPPKTTACRQRPLPPPFPYPASSSANLRRPCDPPPPPSSSPRGLRGRSKRRRPLVASLPPLCAPRAPPTQVRSPCLTPKITFLMPLLGSFLPKSSRACWIAADGAASVGRFLRVLA
jgi:hypothetical protein